MNPQRINMITLATADIARARAYYTALGWQEAKGGNSDIAFFKLDGQFMSLYRREPLQKDISQKVPMPATGAITLAQNFASAAEVDSAHGAALRAGATEIVAPTQAHWGGYSGMVADLDGHLWEHAYNPFWTLTSDGMLSGEA